MGRGLRGAITYLQAEEEIRMRIFRDLGHLSTRKHKIVGDYVVNSEAILIGFEGVSYNGGQIKLPMFGIRRD